MIRLSSLPTVIVFTFFCLIGKSVIAQCDLTDKTPVTVVGISVTNVDCPQNGSITVNGVSGGGGDYVYEIFSGPILRGIQSQNVFSALLPGNYRIRVTGCKGVFYESAVITVGNNYLEPATQTTSFIVAESFKCNTTNSGKVRISLSLALPNNLNSDTQYYRLPLRYQVSTNGDPATGFASSPYFNLVNNSFSTRGGGSSAIKSIIKYDTIKGLNAGTTYYVRVTDACGVFKTTSITLPSITNPTYTYAFQVKEPYVLPPFTSDYPAVKGACIQWGELTIFSNGSPISSIPSTNTYMPLTAVLKRQDNGQVISSRIYQSGSLQKFTYSFSNPNNNNLIFDSVPRIPVTLELTDQCGTVTTINANAPSVKVPFKIQAFSSCASYSYFYVNTINAAPSLPLRFKIYDNSNTLLVDKMMSINYQHVYIPNTGPILCCDQQSFVPSFGTYRIVYEDQCGIRDSLVFNFGGGGSTPAPAFNFNAYQPLCSSGDGINRYTVDAVQTVTSPVSKIEIVSGPAGLYYPRVLKSSSVSSGISSGSYSSYLKKYFDSLIVGSYQVRVQYGCNQVLNTSFTVTSGAAINLTGNLAFTLQSNLCSAAGSVVTADANITSTDVNYIVNDPPWIRITSAPLQFLKSISRSRDGSDPVLPFNLGIMHASDFLSTGIDTARVSVYPMYGFPLITSGGFNYPAGNYTFQLYAKCSGRVLDTKSFTVTDAGYSKPNLGASSAYLCDGGNLKAVLSPTGGRRNFLYQIKLASDPNDAHYTAMQADSVFVLPNSTTPGTVYTVRAIDACNNSFVGQVVVNSFTGTLYVSSSNDCIGAPTRILAGLIPGAIYTWTKPDGTVIVTNSNELNISSVSIADIGVYYVAVNALNGCISKGAAGVFGSRCYAVLPVSFTDVAAKKISENAVDIQWETTSEVNVHHYDVERSIDGVKWTKIAQQASRAGGAGSNQHYFQLDDKIVVNSTTPVIYYRIKAVDAGGQVNYSPVRKVYFSSGFNVIKVYPTPFISSLSIDFMSESTEKAVVSLFDMSGREVSKSVMPVAKGINHYQYTPVFKIDAGNYILTLTQGTNRYSNKVTKVN